MKSGIKSRGGWQGQTSENASVGRFSKKLKKVTKPLKKLAKSPVVKLGLSAVATAYGGPAAGLAVNAALSATSKKGRKSIGADAARALGGYLGQAELGAQAAAIINSSGRDGSGRAMPISNANIPEGMEVGGDVALPPAAREAAADPAAPAAAGGMSKGVKIALGVAGGVAALGAVVAVVKSAKKAA